jgi:hypothetical protein
VHVMAISEIADDKRYWGALKKAHGRLPKGARWSLAVASADGSRAINVIVHSSVAEVQTFLEEYAGEFARTEYFEADASNAVGLPK